MLPHICVFFPLPLSLALISSDFLFLHTNDAALYENWMELEPVTTILKAHIWTLYTKQRYKVMLDLKQKHTTFQLSPPPPCFPVLLLLAPLLQRKPVARLLPANWLQSKAKRKQWESQCDSERNTRLMKKLAGFVTSRSSRKLARF